LRITRFDILAYANVGFWHKGFPGKADLSQRLGATVFMSRIRPSIKSM